MQPGKSYQNRSAMNIHVEHNHLTSYTLQHLLGWVEALGHLIGTEDWPFESAEELAMQLENWREEFQSINGPGIIGHEEVKVMTYGDQVILMVQETAGEFIKLTLNPIPQWNTAMS